jgi:nucleotide-binding universal stress UspA family protein
MFERTVVATDLSGASDSLLGCLPGLRNLGTEQIFLVHALGIRHLEEMKHLLTPMVEPRLQDQKRRVGQMGFAVSIVIMPGLAFLEIGRAAAQQNASLIVLGSHGATAAREVLLGGVAMRLLHEVSKPVLLFRLEAPEESARKRSEYANEHLLAHILYPTDFSDTAELALRTLMEFAKAGAAKITLLHVQDEAHIGKHFRDKIEEFNRIDRLRLERVQSELRSAGVEDVSIEIACGSPTREIIRCSTEGDATMIVMGSQGRGFISEVFLGSVSHNVARQSPIPLLLVPAIR